MIAIEEKEMKGIVFWAAPLMILAAPALAAQSATDAPAADQGVTVKAKPKKVCRTVEATGRRISNSVCRTSEQWAAIDKANEEAALKFTNSMTNNRNTSTGPGVDSRGGMGSGPPQ